MDYCGGGYEDRSITEEAVDLIEELSDDLHAARWWSQGDETDAAVDDRASTPNDCERESSAEAAWDAMRDGDDIIE